MPKQKTFSFQPSTATDVSEVNAVFAENYKQKAGIIRPQANRLFSHVIQVEDLITYSNGFVVYCSDDDCGSSEDLAYQLQDQGFINIYLFKGGWKQWTESDLPIELK